MAIASAQVTAVAQLLGGKHADIPKGYKGAEGGGASQADAGAADDEPTDEPTDEPATGAGAHGDDSAGGDSQGDGEGSPAADGDGSESEQPYTLKELAAKLEVPTKALYDLDIPLGDGQHATLGEIKTGYIAGRAALAEVEQVRSDWEDRERELMVERHRVGQIVQALGQNIPPAALQVLAEREQEAAARERAAVLRAIPTWAKPEVYEADAAVMLDFLKTYGFGKRDLDAVGDHKLVKLLYDSSKVWAKAKQLRAAPSTRNTARAGQNTPAPRAAPALAGLRATIERAKSPQATRSDKLAGISALIR